MNKYSSSLIDTSIGRFLVLNNDKVSKNLEDDNTYEPKLMELFHKIIPIGSNVVDCGAYIGTHSVVLGNIVGDNGKVFSFEPVPIPFLQLCGNIFINGLNNVRPYNMALSSSDNDLLNMFYRNPFSEKMENYGNSRIVVKASNTILVKSTTLDSYNLKDIFLIKIDVEGHEIPLLIGAKETIENNRPLIVIEISRRETKESGLSQNDYISYIRGIKYRLFDLKENENYFCIPEEKMNTFGNYINEDNSISF